MESWPIEILFADNEVFFLQITEPLNVAQRIKRGASSVVVTQRGLDGGEQFGLDEPR